MSNPPPLDASARDELARKADFIATVLRRAGSDAAARDGDAPEWFNAASLCEASDVILALLAAVERGGADSARLDWLETQVRDDATENFGAYDQHDNLWHMRDGTVRDSLRDAVDAARSPQPGTDDGQ